MDKIKGKKKVYEMWKKGLYSWRKCRSVVRACKEVTRKAKAHVELKLAREKKDNKKGVFHVNSKRKTRNNVVPC